MQPVTQSSTAHGTAPTRTRNVVLWFATTLAIITYIDRVCISQAAPLMQADLGLTKVQMGFAFTAFGWAYALFEIPGGWLGDRIGPRKVLMRVVSMWSIFTIATGWATNLVSLVTYRFLFGVGEAGCFPNIAKMFTLWFPVFERVKAQGIMWLSARWGGAFTPLLVGWMLARNGEGHAGLGLHYKWVFLIFGLVGVTWAILFFRWFRDNPGDHPGVNAAELAHIGDTSHAGGSHSMPWRKLVSCPTVWALWMQYFFLSYAWYFYITWFPTYLKEQFAGLSDIMRALLACAPLFFGGLSCLISGTLAAPLDRRFGSARARRYLGAAGLAGGGFMMLMSIQFANPILSVLAVGLASFCGDLSMPGAWGACMEVGGRHTGALAGSMNMMGNAGGAVAPMVVPLVLVATQNNWTVNLWLFATAYFLGSVCWLFINTDDRIDP